MKTKSFLIAILVVISTTISFAQTAETTAFSNSYALEAKKDYNGAINSIKPINKPDNYYTNLRLGWLYYLAGNYQSSVTYYQTATKLKPQSEEALFGLANPLAALQKWDDLYAVYGRILAINPNNSTANYRLGLGKYYAKQYDEAEKYVSKSLSLYPFDYDSNLLMAGVKFSQAKLAEAKKYYQIVLLINPGDATATEMLKSL